MTPVWIAYALASALFAGAVAVLAKAGIRHTPSNLATAIRTLVVLVLAWAVVLVVGSQSTLDSLSGRTWLFLVLSGLATGGAWLCYFRALQLGSVNPVVAVDKSSIVLTVVLAIALFGETQDLLLRAVGIAAIAVGTYLMVRWQPPGQSARTGWAWLAYAVGSAVFASLTTILAKVGMEGVESNLGTAIRTVVVLVLAWGIVLVTGEHRQLRGLRRREVLLLIVSGLATGASWLCFFRALQSGPVSGVVPLDRLSVVVTAVLAYVAFRERLTRLGLVGLALIVAGTIAMVV
ncbi:MAG: EamA family transporter [Candidatus Nanopelagicales bacterium]